MIYISPHLLDPKRLPKTHICVISSESQQKKQQNHNDSNKNAN